MVSLGEVFERYSRNPIHFIAPLFFALFLTIAAFFTALALYLFTSMLFTAANVPIEHYPFALGFFMALFVLSTAGFKAGIIKGFEVALRGKRIRLMEFLSISKRKAFPVLVVSLVRLLFWLLFLAPALYLFVEGFDTWLVALAGLAGLFFIALLEYLLLPQYSLIACLDVPAGRSFLLSLKLTLRHWRAFLPLFLLLALNFILKFIPLLQLVSFLLLYPVAYATLVARTIHYYRQAVA